MKWVMIAILANATFTFDYKTEEECKEAVVLMLEQSPKHTKGICIPARKHTDGFALRVIKKLI